jgi:hypothetical protein
MVTTAAVELKITSKKQSSRLTFANQRSSTVTVSKPCSRKWRRMRGKSPARQKMSRSLVARFMPV